MFESDLLSYLKGRPEIVTLIQDKVFLHVLPDPVKLPAMTYQIISRRRSHCLGTDSKSVTSSVQFNLMAKKYSDNKALSKALLLCLRDFSGELKAGGTVIQSVLVQNELDVYQEDSKDYLTLIEFEMTYDED